MRACVCESQEEKSTVARFIPPTRAILLVVYVVYYVCAWNKSRREPVFSLSSVVGICGLSLSLYLSKSDFFSFASFIAFACERIDIEIGFLNSYGSVEVFDVIQ